MFKVNWCKWDKIVNEKFIPYLNCKDRYAIYYGGRGSSKSNFEAKKLIYRCLTEKYFRHLLIRNTYATIKDSQYQTIKDIIFELGLQELFEFKIQPLEIHCINGNSFLARGCDDTQKIKSVKDPTGAWWEEDIPSEADFITVTSSIRTLKAEYLQETFTINPEVEGNYQDHWFWKRFFKPNEFEASFNNYTELKVGEDLVKLPYTVMHSDHTFNKWLPKEFIALLMDLKRTNPYYYEIYCNGKWGNKQLGGRFYKKFDLGKNTYNHIYNPELPLHISFDFNVNPYLSLSVWQISNKSAYLVDEIAAEYPKNTTADACREFNRKYNSHNAGLFVYGDPSGKADSTRTETGYNDYEIIRQELNKFRPEFRIFNTQPPVKLRGDFINSVFESNFDEVSVYINDKSVYLKNDLLFGLEDSDGTKLKQKVKGDDGRSYEKHHHFSDNMDYFLCYAFKESFEKYQKGSVVHNRKTGYQPMNKSLNY